MDNILEITKFGEVWKGTKNFQVTSTGNFVFSAAIIYRSKKRGVERSICLVQIFRNGNKDGDIEVYESDELKSEAHHLSFSVRWQKYLFDEIDSALVVEGESQKMAGDYFVRISPNGLVAKFI